MNIVTYRIEHPRHAMCWVEEWQEWAGELNEAYWTEYESEDEANLVADAIGGMVVETTRPMHYGDVIGHQEQYLQAAE